MGSMGIWHWLVFLFVWLLYLWPLGRILRRTGHSGLWAILSLIPPLFFIFLWVWAYKPWPDARR